MEVLIVCKDVPYSWKREYLGEDNGWWIDARNARFWTYPDYAQFAADAFTQDGAYLRRANLTIGDRY